MKVIYARDSLPTEMEKAIFLAGPTPRADGVKGWRTEALEILADAGYDGHVFVPEPADGQWASNYDEQIKWEEEALNQADCILFWVPREMENMPALTTNDEWGVWKNSGKVVFGAPPDAVKVRYQQYYADEYKVPLADTLKGTLEAALKKVGSGSLRVGGEVKVPLFIWEQSTFQSWLKTQTTAGNKLLDARLLWNFRVGKLDRVFSWALHVDVFIEAEKRSKVNEYIFGRPDISTVVLWHRADTLAETKVVLVKEFRSPARTADGFIRELPGGSSKADTLPVITAMEELREEVTFSIDPNELKPHPFRQLFGTLSVVGAHLFSLEINDEELAFFRSIAGEAHGVVEDSEQTYVEVYTVDALLHKPITDWSTLGMIFAVLAEAMR